MKKSYARYTVKFDSFKGKIKASVIDNQFDSYDYAFFVPGKTVCTSYSDVAASFVQRVLDKAVLLFDLAAPGSCYQILTDGVYGDVVEVKAVPVSWFVR